MRLAVSCALIFSFSIQSNSQCPFGGTNWGDVTPGAVGATVELLNYVWGGDQFNLQAQAGCTYTVTTCGGGFDSQITVFSETLAVVGYNDDFCGLQSTVTFVAPTTGTYTIQVNEYFCITNFTALPYFAVTLDSCAGGCNNPAACNYDVTATDASNCCFDNCLTIELFDSFGDGWNGAIYTVSDTNGVVMDTGTMPTGSYVAYDLCLPDGCYEIYAGGGTFDTEISYIVTGTDAGTTSGGGPITLGFGVNATEDCTIESDAIIVDASTYTSAQLISDVFLGDCLTAANVTFTGAPGAIGSFSNGASIGIEEGIILTSGSVLSAPGPNLIGSTSTANLAAGSPLLDAASGGITYDASIFVFDFEASTTSVTFTYVFASEEYPEFVCSFNDAFGFFVTGPGYAPNTNIATVPGTTDLVSIDNVNNNGALCPPFYPAYYVDNTGGTAIEYDGYTVPLTATINTVPCESYQITIAVADVGDGIYDSACLLQAQSFTAGVNVDVAATASDGTQSSDVNCSDNGTFLFVNDGEPFTEETTINFVISGTAIEGLEYTSIATSVTFQPGEDFTSIDITGIIAQLGVDPSTVTIALTESCSCEPPPEATFYLCLPLMLPVEMVDFWGKQVNTDVEINWATMSEVNSSHFIVMKSTDNESWSKVGALAAAGNSFSRLDYQIYDRNPSQGINYYRLLQVDLDGQSEFSETIAIEYEAPVWQIYPNPASDVLHVHIDDPLSSEIRILALDGRLVSTYKPEADQQQLRIDLDSFIPGTYLIQWLKNGALFQSERVIVE
jgi:hypothetical protein